MHTTHSTVHSALHTFLPIRELSPPLLITLLTQHILPILSATALHYTTLHYTTLLHCTALQCTDVHFTTVYLPKLCYPTLHYTAQHWTSLHYINCTTLHCSTLHYTVAPLSLTPPSLFISSEGKCQFPRNLRNSRNSNNFLDDICPAVAGSTGDIIKPRLVGKRRAAFSVFLKKLVFLSWSINKDMARNYHCRLCTA